MSAVFADLPRTDGYPVPPTTTVRRFRGLAGVLVRGYWRARVHGAEHIPRSGPVLLASNHLGILDGPLLLAVVRPRVVHALVKREMFDTRIGGPLRRLGQISVQRTGVDPAAVKTTLAVLRAGGVVAIYPEGSRGVGDFAHTRTGLAYLAMVTGAPVVPVACLGTRAPGASVGSVPPRRTRLDVVVGEPVRVAQVPWPRRKGEVAATAERLRQVCAEHVRRACLLTGQTLPGRAPDSWKDAPGRAGPEVGPAATGEVVG